MDVDLFLLIFVIALIGGAVGANIKLLFHYQADDSSALSYSIVVKAVIVLSLTLAWTLNILIPVDVRNSRPDPGLVDMQAVWSAAYIVLAVFLILVVPGALFYHEVEDDEDVKRKWLYVLQRLVVVTFFGVLALVGTWPFLADAEIPVQEYACDSWASDVDLEVPVCDQSEDAILEVKVSIWIYAIAFLSFLGSFFFATFGGIGLAAVPVDLFIEFIDRPRDIRETQFQQRKRMLGRVATRLLEISEELIERDGELLDKGMWSASRKRRKLRNDYAEFQRNAHVLEDAFEKMQIAKYQKGESILVSACKLVCGIVFSIMSLLWVLHIILYVILGQAMPAPPTGFLNELIGVWENLGLYPLSVALFASFNLYLLLCVVKGCMKVGMRACFIISVHPMRYKATPLHSFLFNVWLVLLASGAVVQFAQEAFADYARLTDAELIFAAQTRHLSFYKFFFEHSIFMYWLLAWCLVSLIYLLLRPRDVDPSQVEKILDKHFAKLSGMDSAAEVSKPAASKPAASKASGSSKRPGAADGKLKGEARK
mmetsp:Transcript_52071/g.123982  ORF Transcript_52071/g.123982 Transcript_52071/m.123982 type:complete len:540 (-) Transcript_52071:83-1702(-)